MNTITSIFTCAAIGNADTSAGSDIFLLMLIILILDDERREKERRRKREQARRQAQVIAKPRPPAGPR